MGFSQAGMRERVAGVENDRLLQEFDGRVSARLDFAGTRSGGP